MTEERALLDGILVVQRGGGTAELRRPCCWPTWRPTSSGSSPGGYATRGGLRLATLNRTKQSVVLDLADAADVERLHGLLGGADAVG